MSAEAVTTCSECGAFLTYTPGRGRPPTACKGECREKAQRRRIASWRATPRALRVIEKKIEATRARLIHEQEKLDRLMLRHKETLHHLGRA